MISLLNKSKNNKSYQYIDHLQWVVFFLFALTSLKSVACMPMPIEVSFAKTNKLVIVEALEHRSIVLKTKSKINFSKVEGITTQEVNKNTFFGMSGEKGYYINSKKAGEYSITASDGDKKITIQLVIKKEKRPSFGRNEKISRSVPKSKSLSNKVVTVESKGCGGASKVKYH